MTTRIVDYTYTRRLNRGNYEHEEATAHAVFDDDTDQEAAAEAVREFVNERLNVKFVARPNDVEPDPSNPAIKE